ncbi:hypothetical protein D3C86_1775910 [compost metagenome]
MAAENFLIGSFIPVHECTHVTAITLVSGFIALMSISTISSALAVAESSYKTTLRIVALFFSTAYSIDLSVEKWSCVVIKTSSPVFNFRPVYRMPKPIVVLPVKATSSTLELI